MKRKRFYLIKRIFICFCCTLLLTTNIFLSYNTAVHAAHDYDVIDAADDLLNICLVIGGIIFSAPSGGLSYLATIKGIIGLRDSAENLIDYITDNGDGTYTIDESLIQAALQAAEELEAQGFTDKDIIKQKNGSYDFHYAVSNSQFMHNYVPGCTFEGLINMNGLVACHVEPYPTFPGTYLFKKMYAYNSSHIVEYERKKFWNGDTDNLGSSAIFGETFGANVPIFSDLDSLNSYLANGTGYKDALNYRPAPLFRRHSSYSPIYTGGAVTVNRTVIDNINSKITEVDADDSLSDDQKIEILQQYIRSGVNPTPTPPPAPSDPDYDDNKDLPSGTDLTDTNSWLKKIYLKVCQIYAKMNAAVEDAEDAALAKIQESLDEIIVQLKKIKHWAAVDTVIDGVDAVADWLDLIYDVLKNGAGSAVSALSSALEESTDLMSRKFPFSIPWDILFFVSVLSAEPETPHFEIPFNFEYPALDLSVDYQMELDFTPLQWLSDLSRLLLSMTYAVGLMKKTLDIVSANKEG